MKLVGTALLLAGAAALPLANAADERPAAESKPLLEIVAQLEESEYGPIVDASFDDGGWEVETYKGDASLELFVDPKTGEIISEHRDDAEPKPPAGSLKLSDLLLGLDEAGYSDIVEASFERRTWEIEADRDGVKRELRVDPKTGEVVSDRADD